MTLLRQMRARDPGEHHRVSTPLELLFDLTFVVAVSQAAAELAHAVEQGHAGAGLAGYLSVFFAIWWAWMNFTWFASAYDTDDVAYRLLTLVQMAGVLLLAANVKPAFEDGDYRGVTLGYVVMRVALIAQWLRAARADPAWRSTAYRYVLGIGVVQVGWIVRLAVRPPAWGSALIFAALVAAELFVPVWSERVATTPWHAHHIAERYGLFTLIVLGESVLAATTAVEGAVGDQGWSPRLALLGVAALVLLFALWWLYFLHEAGDALDRRRELSFVWGYGHYGIFAGLAALGAGLEVAGADHANPGTAGAWAVAVPVVAVLLLVRGLHLPLGQPGGQGGGQGGRQAARRGLVAVAIVSAVILGAAAATGLGLPVEGAVAMTALAVSALVVRALLDHDEVRAREPVGQAAPRDPSSTSPPASPPG